MIRNLRHLALAALVATPAIALAGDTNAAPQLPVIRPGTSGPVSLNCPAGSRQMGGPDSVWESTFCARIEPSGERVANGQYVLQHKNGQVAAVGQIIEGNKTG